MKLLKKHTIYEIYNEWMAECIYVDQKPTKKELEHIVEDYWGSELIRSIPNFISLYIDVSKMDNLYTLKSDEKE